jgi:hypothetical protein
MAAAAAVRTEDTFPHIPAGYKFLVQDRATGAPACRACSCQCADRSVFLHSPVPFPTLLLSSASMGRCVAGRCAAGAGTGGGLAALATRGAVGRDITTVSSHRSPWPGAWPGPAGGLVLCVSAAAAATAAPVSSAECFFQSARPCTR